MPSYRTYPSSIREVLVYVYSHENEDIDVQKFIDSIDEKVKTSAVYDVGYCLYRGLMYFKENPYLEGDYNKGLSNKYVSGIYGALTGTQSIQLFKKMYKEGGTVQILLTEKGVDYIMNYRKKRFMYYFLPLGGIFMLIIVFILIDFLHP